MNICFICTSLFPKLHKVDNCSLTDNSKCYKVLLKYLLNIGPSDVNNDESSEHQLLSSYFFKQLENAGNGCSVESGGIQFCSQCTQLSKDVWNLRRDLEAIQIKIFDKLKLIHQNVMLGSKFFNKPTTSENHSKEMLYRFQHYVGNNVEWLTSLEPDLWTNNEILSVEEIVKQEPSDDLNLCTFDEMEFNNVFDHVSSTELSVPVESTTPTRKRGRKKKSATESAADNKTIDKSPSIKRSKRLSSLAQKERNKPIIEPSPRPQPPTRVGNRKGKVKGKIPAVFQSKSRKAGARRYQPILNCKPCLFATNKYCVIEGHVRSRHETSTKSFHCSQCALGFTTEHLYNIHTYYHNGKTKCEVCSEPVIILDMKKHLEEVHQKQVFSCPGCSYVFLDYIRLIRHTTEDRHTGLSLPCLLCPEGTPQDPEMCQNRQQLYKHLHIVHNVPDLLFTCDEPDCSRTFFGKKEKEKHMLTHSIFASIKCLQCDAFVDPRRMDSHVRTVHKKEAKFPCDLCSESFVYESQRSRHQIMEHGVPKVKCDVCGKEFMSKTYLTGHQRKAHGNRIDMYNANKVCPICGKSFTTNTILKTHMYIHSDVKDFACEICGFLTKRQGKLNRHMKIHAEIKQHACPHCPKRFTESDCLKLHIRVHTGERPYQCEECGSAFSQRSSMMTHKRKHVAGGSFVPKGPRIKSKAKAEIQTQAQPFIDTTENNV